MQPLNPIEARVLGSLVEKELTTPEYYPLSLNALVNACNQKSNREPHMTLDESAVEQALRSLDKQGLAGRADSDGRVTKYESAIVGMSSTAPEKIVQLRPPNVVTANV